MDVTGINRLASSVADAGLKQEASFAVLKKAMRAESDSAAALLETIQPVSKVSLPAHLGQNINTTA